MLVPVKDAETGKAEEGKVDLPVSGAPQGTTENQDDAGFDSEIRMDKQPNLVDEMRSLSGEDKKPKWRPWFEGQPDDTEEIGTEKEPEPAAKADAKPKDDKPEVARPKVDESAEIDVGGKKMKVVDLAKSYEELQRKFGQQGQEFGSERIKYRAEIERLDGERKFLETMAATNFTDISKGHKGPSAPAESPDEINQEAIDKMLEEGKSVEAIRKIVDSRISTVRKELEDKHRAALAEKEEGDRKRARENAESLARQNLAAIESDPDFQSFKENRVKFGGWMEEMYGSDPVGLSKITEVCTDLNKIKRSYRTYLKDTVDFSAAIERAKADGQSIAATKERLAPVGDRSSVIPSDTKDKPRLRPAPDEDKDMARMENLLMSGMGGRGHFGKDGFLR